jgi:hypothetical protein
MFERVRKGDTVHDLLSSIKDGETLIGLSFQLARGSQHNAFGDLIRSRGTILPPLWMVRASIEIQNFDSVSCSEEHES